MLEALWKMEQKHGSVVQGFIGYAQGLVPILSRHESWEPGLVRMGDCVTALQDAFHQLVPRGATAHRGDSRSEVWSRACRRLSTK